MGHWNDRRQTLKTDKLTVKGGNALCVPWEDACARPAHGGGWALSASPQTLRAPDGAQTPWRIPASSRMPGGGSSAQKTRQPVPEVV